MALKWAQAAVIGVILLVTLIVWGILLAGVWFADPGYTVEPSLLLGAGTLLTALGTATAAALGFGVQEVKTKTDDGKVKLTAIDTAKTVGAPAIAGLIAYAVLGVVIIFTAWLPIGAGGFDGMYVFALSIIGWAAGAFALIK